MNKRPQRILVLAIFFCLIFSAFSASGQKLHWRHFGKLQAAELTTMAVTPNSTIFCATSPQDGYAGGIFKSFDHGVHWQFATGLPSLDQLPVFGIQNLTAISDSVILAEFIPNQNDLARQGGVWRSGDTGRTWNQVLATPLAALFSFTNGTAYAVSDSLRISTDGGFTWQAERLPTVPIYYGGTVLGDELAVIVDSALYLSKDLFAWTVAIPDRYSHIGNVARTYDGRIVVTTASDSLLFSSNNGISWYPHGSVFQHRARYSGNLLLSLKNGSLITNSNISQTFGYSSNDGNSWSQSEGYPTFSGNVQDLNFVVDSSDRVFVYNRFSAGFTDDDSLNFISCLPDNVSVPSLAVSPEENVAERYSLYSSDGGDTWLPLFPTTSGDDRAAWLGYHPRDGFIALNASTLLHSPDCIAWAETNRIPIVSYTNPLGFDRAGNIYCIAGSYSQTMTTDLGITWQTRQTSLHTSSDTHYSPMVGMPNGDCILGSDSGIFRSSDLGVEWEFVKSDAFMGWAFSVASDSNGVLIACTDSGVFRSTNEGIHWQPIIRGLPNDTGQHVIVYSSEGVWLLGTSCGIYIRNGSDTTWIEANDGLADNSVISLDVAGPGKFFAGTSFSGIYTTDATLPVAQRRQAQKSITVLSAYPNPSAKVVRITMVLPHPEEIEIRLFDAFGREVRQLASRRSVTGHAEFTLDHTCMPNGQYFIQAIHDGVASTLPLTFLR